ncbi:UPF0481 protein At3g47200-like [Salvia hispanica]|uniref:UPF0481 protein At3g47200-like n=1 Tax=Salvia hispanica TaxID=49212 RepID=UPI002009A0E8|nr:UPF0481 protein At3g47200-like [Salvia hispanica]
MRRDLFLHIVQMLGGRDAYFQQRQVAPRRVRLSPLTKCMVALRQLSYNTTTNMFDEYLYVKNTTGLVPGEILSHNQKMNSVNEESQTVLAELLVSSFDKKLDKLSADPAYPYAASIYNVSQSLRKEKEEAYTPKLVSIGPLHHDESQLQGMEAFKLRFMYKFLTRFGVGLNTIAKFAAKEEGFVRGCYEGTVKLRPKELAEVIVLDGIFIVELLLENYFIQLRDVNEILFNTDCWMYSDLMHDMLLLENQLPIRIMESLLNFVDLSLNEGTRVTIYDLAHIFFKNIGITSKVPLTAHCSQARHFVEFLLFLHAPTEKHAASKDKGLRIQLASKKFEYNRSATELVKAGVKLRSRDGNCLFEVSFDSEKGVLTIPKLTVNESTETFFRNLIAFEHLGCYGYFSKNITSYVMLMDRFINTSGDVALLVKNGIIKIDIKHKHVKQHKNVKQQVADLFNNLHKGVLTEVNDFYFAAQCESLDVYCKTKWKAHWFRFTMKVRDKCVESLDILGCNYFNNPWSIISVFAASLLLFLTIIQTACSILQVVPVQFIGDPWVLRRN